MGVVGYGIRFCSVSDRAWGIYAQTATPRVSTWTTWAREKKPGKVVEGFPGLKPRRGGLSLSRARNTSSEERRRKRHEKDKRAQASKKET